jgi:ribA/ribD-fused uncharacterized protein
MDWNKIEFKDEKAFLSNMIEAKIVFSGDLNLKDRFPMVEFDNKTYASSEHLYQALKSKDLEWHSLIRETVNPHKTKRLARKKLGKVFEIREDFEEIKLDIMRLVVHLKFKQNEDLAKKLLEIEGDIIERNCWNDTFWGKCDGVGENHLGLILMEMRDELRND